MTVTFDRAINPRPSESPVRLSLAPDGVRPGRLDGAWWPRSRDLLIEIPSLVAELDQRWGRVTRITVNPAQWPEIPRRIPAAGHIIHVGWFTTEQDEHTIMVCSYAPPLLELLIVPPATDVVDAARLMSEAADPGGARPRVRCSEVRTTAFRSGRSVPTSCLRPPRLPRERVRPTAARA